MTVRLLSTLLRQAAAGLVAIASVTLAPPTDLAAQARLGALDFPTSVDGDARADFLLGLGYLHSFEYVDAAEAFRSAQEHAPDFALAYWGEALTYDHPLWGEEDIEAARAALERLAPTPEARLATAPSDRERAYLAAVETLFGDGTKTERDAAYERAMARLAEDYPDDEDAAALHALAVLATSEGRNHETYMRAAAVAERVLDTHPRHPGAVHYLIHAYDDPIHAGLGLSAARVYAEIAPDASHALHMPSHIFFALGMWDDLIVANERAWDVSVERMKTKGLPPATRNFHALFWVHYGYLQAGRWEDAEEVLAIAEASAREGDHAWTAAEMRAHHVAATPDPRDELIERTLATNLDDVGDRAVAASLLAVAAYAYDRDDQDLLERSVARSTELEEGEGDVHAARLAIGALEVRAERPDSAIALLEAANALYFGQPYTFGPPSALVKPPAELLGETLIEAGRYEEARHAFERALSRAPSRRASLAGLERFDTLTTAEGLSGGLQE